MIASPRSHGSKTTQSSSSSSSQQQHHNHQSIVIDPKKLLQKKIRKRTCLCLAVTGILVFVSMTTQASSRRSKERANGKYSVGQIESEIYEHFVDPIYRSSKFVYDGLVGHDEGDFEEAAAEEDADGDEKKKDEEERDERADTEADVDDLVAADENVAMKYRDANDDADKHSEEENQEVDQYEVRTMERNVQIEREVKRDLEIRKATNMPKAYQIHKSNARCANAPKDMQPKFTKQTGLRKKESKALPAKAGYVGVSRIDGATKGTVRVRTENGPRTKRVESSVNPIIKNDDEKALVTCLEDLSKCEDDAVRRAAWKLAGAMDAKLGKSLGGIERKKTCAIVGNSGALMAKAYGEYIDKHDVVVRINVLDNNNARFNASLGQKATYRVLSYKMSKDVCCIQPATKHPPDNNDLIYLAWFPAMRKQLIARLSKRQKRKVIEMDDPFLKSIITSFKSMRDELVRLGFGPFEDWEYMTSGMHAVLTFARSCETIDVYGFTTDSGGKEPYWFTGRKVAPRSGRTQHAWDHERMILRLLAAVGVVNVCT